MTPPQMPGDGAPNQVFGNAFDRSPPRCSPLTRRSLGSSRQPQEFQLLAHAAAQLAGAPRGTLPGKGRRLAINSTGVFHHNNRYDLRIPSNVVADVVLFAT